MKYTSLKDSAAELTVSRSRFLAFAFRVEDEADVTSRLKELRKKYHDATHVCYAAIWDEAGAMTRQSDDGEPSGTAGAPILEAIKGANLVRCMVAVVRYFGGIKLGTGGLTRAYGGVAAEALAKAEKIEYVLCDLYSCETDFATYKRLNGFKGICDVVYDSNVTFTYACPSGEGTQRLVDRASGKIRLSLSATRFTENIF